MAIGNNNKKIKIKQIKLLSTASPGWGQRPFLDYIRPGVIKEILRPLSSVLWLQSSVAGAGAQLPSETRGRGL